MSGPEAELDLGEEAAWVAAALVIVASLAGAVVLAEWPLWGVTPDQPEEPRLVEPAEDGTALWPYTARAQSYESRTLGINTVFFGNPDDVHTALTERSELTWEDEQVHEGDADAETVSRERVEFDPETEDLADVITWSDADGATRYTYVEVDGDGRWVEESSQLHAGTYLGHRIHIRAYDDPQGEWTAVQIHDEHWDWFRLRHTVTGISDAQRELELEFMDEPYVDDVVRMPFGNETADSDGWVTGITLATAGLPFVLVVLGRGRRATEATVAFVRRRRRAMVLGAVLFALYTAVRWLGIAGELLYDGEPTFVAAPLYLALAVGTPALAYAIGRDSDATWAFTFAAVGLGAAFVVDFAAMGVSVLPLRVVIHRGAVLLAVGLVAHGAAQAVDEAWPLPLFFGLGGWVLALLLPLIGYI